MSRDINDLSADFQPLVIELLAKCADQNIIMTPYSTLRDPKSQAKLWRQSRTTKQINEALDELRDENADFLADCLESVGPQYGDHVTNALPGLSWHQWGESVDCYWNVDGRAEWSTRVKIDGKNGYRVYAALAESMELEAGGNWSRLKDWPHVQRFSESSPLHLWSWAHIDDKMETLWSGH